MSRSVSTASTRVEGLVRPIGRLHPRTSGAFLEPAGKDRVATTCRCRNRVTSPPAHQDRTQATIWLIVMPWEAPAIAQILAAGS